VHSPVWNKGSQLEYSTTRRQVKKEGVDGGNSRSRSIRILVSFP
jgi:hypothetical protein